MFFSYENLAHRRVIWFIHGFNLLSINQFGLLAGQNTSDVPTEFVDEVYDAIIQNGVLLKISLCYSKAFETVDHEILEKNNVLLWL